MADITEKKQEAKERLELLRQGNVANIEIPSALFTFGKAEYLEARPDVELLLTNPEPEIRKTALKVLTSYWYLDDYWETARDFLEHDPDADCRAEGAFALGVLRRDTGDRKILAVLAKVVKDENEGESVRITAYQAMRSIVQFDIEEHKRWMREGFTFEKDVNWAFVDACLEQGEGDG